MSKPVGTPVGTLGKPSILGATGVNPFLPQNAATVSKTAAPVIVTANTKTQTAAVVQQAPVITANPAAPTNALAVANTPVAPVAPGPSTGRKVVDIACAVYNHLPSGSNLAAAGAAVGYGISGPGLAIAGAVVGYALPYIARTATVKLAPRFPSLQPSATQLTHQPKVVAGLIQAGLENADLVHIDITALTAKMARMADTDRQTLSNALAILKGNGLLNAANAKAVIDSPKPMELIRTMVAQTAVFAAVPCRNAIVGSANPQAMAKTFELLMTVQLLDKGDNLKFVQDSDPVALESIVSTLARAGVLNPEMFEKVKASKNLQGLAAGLEKLEAAGLLKREKTMLGMGKVPGLLEGIPSTGNTHVGETFLAVMDADQPDAMASGIVELKDKGILGHRKSFEAVAKSTDPKNMGIAIAQCHLRVKRQDRGIFTNGLDSKEFDFVRNYTNPRALASILKSLNDASGQAGTLVDHLLSAQVLNAVRAYNKGDPVFLAKALEELKNAEILDAVTLKAVLEADEPLALAQLCCILAKVNHFNRDWIARHPLRKADNAIALKIVRDAGALQDSDQKVTYVSAIFDSPTPIVEAKRIAQDFKEEQKRQAQAHLARVRAVVVPLSAPVPVVPVVVGKTAAETQREAAVLSATGVLTAAGITVDAFVDAVKKSVLPERMAAAIVRLAQLDALNDKNVTILRAQDTVLEGPDALIALAQNLALLD